jgi:hypothetical protein
MCVYSYKVLIDGQLQNRIDLSDQILFDNFTDVPFEIWISFCLILYFKRSY